MDDKLFLCRLKRVALVGPISGRSFLDKWYLHPENLTRLGDCIGMQLECVEPEVRAGRIKSGTLCKDICTGAYVLFLIGPPQNKFTSLTELSISAGGYKILNIVWISEYFEQKHRAALSWLNSTNLEGILFFGIEIEPDDADEDTDTEVPAEQEEQVD
ncbi:hypothetical protein [Desulfatitalea tepidiphila]|uniref:hypothetical protein n=1 Tax=Desulfatitalea tepidiphila TaxID=1185843 RepID=UPI0006B49679|nr:hypothetical protein [Desulfatitalea tepidiphila]